MRLEQNSEHKLRLDGVRVEVGNSERWCPSAGAVLVRHNLGWVSTLNFQWIPLLRHHDGIEIRYSYEKVLSSEAAHSKNSNVVKFDDLRVIATAGPGAIYDKKSDQSVTLGLGTDECTHNQDD